jgi:hypothetical protein
VVVTAVILLLDQVLLVAMVDQMEIQQELQAHGVLVAEVVEQNQVLH